MANTISLRTSPLQRLMTRNICACNSSRGATRSLTRLLSSSASHHGNFPSPTTATFATSESLKRRYQPTKQEVDKNKIEQAQLKKRMRRSAYGLIACTFALFGTIYLYPGSPKDTVTHLDAPPSIPGVPDSAIPDVEQVETGTSTIPTFPKTILLSETNAPGAAIVGKGEQEYQLVGLGIRTVSFLSIQVYVVGMYIAVSDIATLQERLIRTVDSVATTLVPEEKNKLKAALLDPERGEEIWDAVLKDGSIRTVFRIVPTRNTDFMHLRDGWVRGITGKTQHFSASKQDSSFSDVTFGESLNNFKQLFAAAPRKNVPKGDVLLLTRDAQGEMAMWYEDQGGKRTRFGQLSDERISRLIWLLYLAGKNVSSESARKSVIEGVMEYVERPVGTVATQVV